MSILRKIVKVLHEWCCHRDESFQLHGQLTSQPAKLVHFNLRSTTDLWFPTLISEIQFVQYLHL